MACRQSLHARRPFLLGAGYPAPPATYPDDRAWTRPGATSHFRAKKLRAVPIRSCSRWGLPCRRRCRRRGALLPHHFTLAAVENATHRGGLFSVALSLGSRPPDVIRHRLSMEPGLSSPAPFRNRRERPSGRLTIRGMGAAGSGVKRRRGVRKRGRARRCFSAGRDAREVPAASFASMHRQCRQYAAAGSGVGTPPPRRASESRRRR